MDESQYEEAITSSCLVHDLSQLPMGDKTEIGSRGLNLSGGQRQRMAIARMLYAGCDIVVLDDPFSSLDGRTEDQIIRNLFGPEGIFRMRRTTVFWISNATHHFELIDVVVVLEKSRIKEFDHWSLLSSIPETSRKIISAEGQILGLPETQVEQLETRKKRAKERDIRVDLSRETGNLSLYGYYLKSAGSLNALFMMTCTATYSFFITFPHYWLKRWTDADQSDEWLYMLVYGLRVALGWLITRSNFLSSPPVT